MLTNILYPSAIDNSTSLPLVKDNSTQINADAVNPLREAIISIENALGIKPGGTSGTVSARMSSFELLLQNIIQNQNTTIQIPSFGGDLTGSISSQSVVSLSGQNISTSAGTLQTITTTAKASSQISSTGNTSNAKYFVETTIVSDNTFYTVLTLSYSNAFNNAIRFQVNALATNGDENSWYGGLKFTALYTTSNVAAVSSNATTVIDTDSLDNGSPINGSLQAIVSGTNILIQVKADTSLDTQWNITVKEQLNKV